MMDAAIRFRRQVAHLHSLGARAVAEILEEIARTEDCTATILDLLAEYEQRLTPDLLHSVGGDRFPPRLPLLVPR